MRYNEFIGSVIIALIFLISILYVGNYIIRELTRELEEQNEEITKLSNLMYAVIAGILFIIIILTAIGIRMVTRKEMKDDIILNYEPIEPSQSGDIPEKILQKRFVKGEISNEEYTEKMARL